MSRILSVPSGDAAAQQGRPLGSGRGRRAGNDDWFEDGPAPAGAGARWLAVAAGVGTSGIILLALHLAQRLDVVKPMVETRELRAIALPPPPPPPTVTRQEPPPPELMEMVPVPTESPVKFVVPLDPLPVPRLVAEPKISFEPQAFKPDSRTLAPPPDRLYQAAEVDRIPVPIFRKTPRVTHEYLRTLRDTRVRLTFVVNMRGEVENITVVQAATPQYGELVAEAVAAWRFEPAIKGGRRVRCFVLQSVTVHPPGGGFPFSVD